LAALKAGDFEAMLANMAENVVLVADSGGRPGALLQPLHGREPIARIMIAVTAKVTAPTDEVCRATVNGLPGMVRFRDGQAQGVVAFGVVGGRIEAVFVMSNPEKLKHLDRRAPGAGA
jgi:RNA polymerase sigma-70 factor (ECF subfamily)